MIHLNEVKEKQTKDEAANQNVIGDTTHSFSTVSLQDIQNIVQNIDVKLLQAIAYRMAI